jgi:phenylpropionate dioxygenase-like ring-hydroxylating dioxygenase large terminal subunit
MNKRDLNIELGAARCPGMSVQDVLDADGDIAAQPEAYRSESYRFLGDEDIPYERYTSKEFFQSEMDNMWPRVWQWACREEHIPEAGDYYVYDIGNYSLIVTRMKDGGIKAFFNSCMHRGTKLKPSGSQGRSRELACPFHGWTWALDGTLSKRSAEWDFSHAPKEKQNLREARVDTWAGFVFVNMDPDAMPLAEYLAPLPDHATAAALEQRYIAVHVEKELPCNWKVAQEAFMEAYHLEATHPQLLTANGDLNTQYDIYTDYVNRLFSPAGVSSPILSDQPDQQMILDSMVLGDREAVGDRLKVAPGDNARRMLAQYFKDTVRESSGLDMDGRSISEMIDTVQYLVFPNSFFFLAVSFPVFYRFRPLGMDPNKTLFDLILMPPLPKSGDRPPPAEPYRLKAEDSYTTAPGIAEALGIVFDQDTGNMQAQQEGFLAGGKSGATLGNYQEVRIRHMHQTLDKFLAMPALKRV